MAYGDDLDSRPIGEHQKLGQIPSEGNTPGRWVDSHDLQVGDVVLLQDGGLEPITSIEVTHHTGPVYNFRVAELQCYAVGDCLVLVHNSCSFGSPEFGQQVHEGFADALRKMNIDVSDIIDRTAKGLTGIDITFNSKSGRIFDAVDGVYRTFKHAELKPATMSGLRQFSGQLQRWRGLGERGNVALFMYDATGEIRFFGVF